jgi:hypothetical protein
MMIAKARKEIKPVVEEGKTKKKREKPVWGATKRYTVGSVITNGR